MVGGEAARRYRARDAPLDLMLRRNMRGSEAVDGRLPLRCRRPCRKKQHDARRGAANDCPQPHPHAGDATPGV